MFNLARQNNFTDVSHLNASLSGAVDHTAVQSQAKTIVRGTDGLMNTPVVIVTTTNPEKGGPATVVVNNQPLSEVCVVATQSILKNYTVVGPEHVANPIGVGSLTLLTSAILAASRVRRQRRKVGTVKVPSAEMNQALEDGTATTLDKLKILTYRQAVAKRGGEVLQHKPNRKAVRALSGIAGFGLVVALSTSIPNYLGSIDAPVKDVKKPIITSSDCSPDLPVITSPTDSTQTKHLNVLIEDLPPEVKLSVGK